MFVSNQIKCSTLQLEGNFIFLLTNVLFGIGTGEFPRAITQPVSHDEMTHSTVLNLQHTPQSESSEWSLTQSEGSIGSATKPYGIENMFYFFFFATQKLRVKEWLEYDIKGETDMLAYLRSASFQSVFSLTVDTKTEQVAKRNFLQQNGKLADAYETNPTC